MKKYSNEDEAVTAHLAYIGTYVTMHTNISVDNIYFTHFFLTHWTHENKVC